MMHRTWTALLGLLAIAALGTTSASADGGRRGSVKDAPYGGINWSGFYIGIQGGYAWGDTQHVFTAPPALDAGTWDTSGGVFGVTWGTNWQRGNWVYGLESDFSFSSVDGSHVGPGCGGPATTCYTDIRTLSTSRGRVGYAVDNRLIYITGGLAYGKVDAGINAAGMNDEKTRFGWALGAGLEWAFAPRWSLKAEYLHVDLGDRDHYDRAVNSPGKVDVTAEIVRLGLNYNLGPDFWSNMLGRRW